jgi:hypothetical protein
MGSPAPPPPLPSQNPPSFSSHHVRCRALGPRSDFGHRFFSRDDFAIEPLKIIDRVTYRADGAGYLKPGYHHLFVVTGRAGAIPCLLQA